MTIENTVDFAFVGNLVLKNHVLILHVVEVSQAHPAGHHRMHPIHIQKIRLHFLPIEFTEVLSKRGDFVGIRLRGEETAIVDH